MWERDWCGSWVSSRRKSSSHEDWALVALSICTNWTVSGTATRPFCMWGPWFQNLPSSLHWIRRDCGSMCRIYHESEGRCPMVVLQYGMHFTSNGDLWRGLSLIGEGLHMKQRIHSHEGYLFSIGYVVHVAVLWNYYNTVHVELKSTLFWWWLDSWEWQVICREVSFFGRASFGGWFRKALTAPVGFCSAFLLQSKQSSSNGLSLSPLRSR